MATEELTNILQSDPNYETIKCLITTILSAKTLTRNVMQAFLKQCPADSVYFLTWRILPSFMAKTELSPAYIVNLLELIEKLPLRYLYFDDSIVVSESNTCKYSNAKKAVNEIWSIMMGWKYFPAVRRKVIIVLTEKLMPYLEDRVEVANFLIDSIMESDNEDLIDELALIALSLLVKNYALRYQDLFTKLYSMFIPEVYKTKNKGKLLYFTYFFLDCSYLPDALVAAFVKRISRLIMAVTPKEALVLLILAKYTITRHPGLVRLIHNPFDGAELLPPRCVENDPYLVEERDPFRSNAMASTFWEIRELQTHRLWPVAHCANYIDEYWLPEVFKKYFSTFCNFPESETELHKRSIKTIEDIIKHYEESTLIPASRRLRVLKLILMKVKSNSKGTGVIPLLNINN